MDPGWRRHLPVWNTSDYVMLDRDGNWALRPGDTVRLSLAYMFNNGAESKFDHLVAEIPPACCTDLTGNVDCGSCGPGGYI